MKILLDTHAFIWFVGGNSKLSPFARNLIEDLNNERFLSVASLWEMLIKISMERLRIDLSFSMLFDMHIKGNRIELLHITPTHLDILSDLPFHHKDPFDRLIIAQAQCDGLTVLSRDGAFDNYEINRFWNKDVHP